MEFAVNQHMEQFEYRHKKFDQRKRSREEEDLEDLELGEIDVVNDDTNDTLHCYHPSSWPPSSSSSSSAFTGPQYSPATQISTTPLLISSDSNSSTDVLFVTENIDGTSTPLQKRRKLWPQFQQQQSSGQHYFKLTEDSGIALTPQRNYNISPCLAGANVTPMKNQHFSMSSHTPTTTRSPAFQTQRGNTQKPKTSGINKITSPVTSAAASAASVLPKISDATLRNICKYHGNMVRQFPKKQRSEKDQERRNKNTLACRMSRRVKKLEGIAIEEQYKEFADQHFDIVEQTMRAAAYLSELIKLVATVENRNTSTGNTNFSDVITPISVIPNDGKRKLETCDISPQKSSAKRMITDSTMITRKKSFSIAFLMADKREKC